MQSEADLVFGGELIDLEIFRGLTAHLLSGPPGHRDTSWLPEGVCAAVIAAGVPYGLVRRERFAW